MQGIAIFQRLWQYRVLNPISISRSRCRLLLSMTCKCKHAHAEDCVDEHICLAFMQRSLGQMYLTHLRECTVTCACAAVRRAG